MVLQDLGQRISRALATISSASLIDEKVLDACLKEICTALLQSDVNVRVVSKLRNNVKKKVNLPEMAEGLNKQKVIEKAVFEELVAMLDAGDDAAKRQEPKKGKPFVVMFVGLQGAGKTTTCTKYAWFYKRKGFKPAMVCADTFRAGAFDQLKQNATKAQIPFYGSYQETDPAVIAQQGVDRFKTEGRDLIIVDTSGRHKQQEALFEEMRQVASAVEPDLVIFVMDSSIGQAAQDQAQAFKDSVEVGAVIMTKVDGHAKGGGALSAVAATHSPIIFMGTGEHMDEFEQFETRKFVSRLLGKGDWSTFIDKVQDVIPEDSQSELMSQLARGFTLRIMYDQFASMQSMGSMSQLMSLVPGFSNALMPPGQENESKIKVKRYLTMMDSMTDKEMDTTDIKLFSPGRIERIARGSGSPPAAVGMMLEEYRNLSKLFANAMKTMKIPKNFKGDINSRKMQMDAGQMSRILPPHMIKMMGGPAAIQALMKQMEGK